jgi:hypothetical protein
VFLSNHLARADLRANCQDPTEPAVQNFTIWQVPTNNGKQTPDATKRSNQTLSSSWASPDLEPFPEPLAQTRCRISSYFAFALQQFSNSAKAASLILRIKQTAPADRVSKMMWDSANRYNLD